MARLFGVDISLHDQGIACACYIKASGGSTNRWLEE